MDAPRDRRTEQTLAAEGLPRFGGTSSSGTVRRRSAPLEDRFNVSRSGLARDYEFRDAPGRVAFREIFRTLRSEQHGGAAVVAMVDRAVERGWARVRAGGSAEFRRQTWIAGSARGLSVVGHEPTDGDRAAMRAERQRLAVMSEPRRAEPDPRSAPGRRDRERTPDDKARKADGAGAVLRALEQVMERDGVPQQHRTAIRNLVSSQLATWQATGRQTRLRVIDRAAPRVPQSIPQHDLRRAVQERAR